MVVTVTPPFCAGRKEKKPSVHLEKKGLSKSIINQWRPKKIYSYLFFASTGFFGAAFLPYPLGSVALAACDFTSSRVQVRTDIVCDYDANSPGASTYDIDGVSYFGIKSSGVASDSVLLVEDGGTLNSLGNTYIEDRVLDAGKRGTFMLRRGGKANIYGNLYTKTRGTENARSIIVESQSKLYVQGDLYSFRSGPGGTSTVEVTEEATLQVDGNAYMHTDSSELTHVFRQYGTSIFANDLELVSEGGAASVKGIRPALYSNGYLSVGGTLTVQAEGTVGIRQRLPRSEGDPEQLNKIVAKQLKITTTENPGGGLVSPEAADAYHALAGVGSFGETEIKSAGRGIVIDGAAQLDFGMGGDTMTLQPPMDAGLAIGADASIQAASTAIVFAQPLNSYTLIRDGATVQGQTALYSDDAGDAVLEIEGGAQVSGSISMGDGSDTLILNRNVALGAVPNIDGGDDLSGLDGQIDTLIFKDYSSSVSSDKFTNWENVVVDGGVLSFSNKALTTATESDLGLFITNNGTLEAGDLFTLTGNMHLAPTGTFQGLGQGHGVYQINGNVHNAGILSLSDNGVGDRLLIAGDYVGDNGLLVLNTQLGADDSPTDKAIISGDTSGQSFLKVVNRNGLGALTTADGIQVIQVGGLSDGLFTLSGDYDYQGSPVVVGGAYAYRLYQGGVSDADDGQWYLRSNLLPPDDSPPKPSEPSKPSEPLYQAGVPVYEAYPSFLQGLNELPTWQRRVGNRFWNNADGIGENQGTSVGMLSTAEPMIEGSGVWMRTEGQHTKIKPRSSTSRMDYDYDSFKLQLGYDRLLHEGERGKTVGGINAQYIYGKADVDSIYGRGKIKSSGYGIGGTLTWYGNNHIYVDNQIALTWYDSDLKSRTASLSLVNGNDGFGYAVSTEVGKRFALNNNWSITPQMQLTYSHVSFDSFRDAFDARVSRKKTGSLQGRLGLNLNYQNAWVGSDGKMRRNTVYGTLDLINEFMGKNKVTVSGVPFSNKARRQWLSLGLGGTYNWDNDKFSLYGEVAARTALSHFGKSRGYLGVVGLRVRW